MRMIRPSAPWLMISGGRDETAAAIREKLKCGERSWREKNVQKHASNRTAMIAKVSLFCLLSSSLLLFNLTGAKPVSNLESLKELLEEEANLPYFRAEESEMEQKDVHAERRAPALAGTGGAFENEELGGALAIKEDALERLLGDILSTTKRSWSRFKKGGLRSCFGVRLERIGSFSGLGC